MAQQIRTHLMFDGMAEAAMQTYTALFTDSEIKVLIRYDEGDNSGKLQFGVFTLAGREFSCMDTPVKHDFGFTPAVSIFVDCQSEQEIARVYEALITGGAAMMPLDDYGFSRRFGWLNDRFGVSWQLNLP